jgi:acetylornithine deacetylase
MAASSPPGTKSADEPPVRLQARDQQVLEALDEDEALELARNLIELPSENPPGNELACAMYLSSFLEARGVPCELVEVMKGRPNLYGAIGTKGQTLVLCGHLDTVPAGEGWTRHPFRASVEDGRLYGRGACDMKAGLAAMTAAMLAVKRSGVELSGVLAFHGVMDEEVGSAGSISATAEKPADWCVVTEPTGGQVFALGNGQANFEVVFHGKAVHSSHPEDGRNAIYDAAGFVRLLEEETSRLRAAPFAGIGPATYSVGLVAGGRGGSTVADRCQLTVDRRVLPSETLEQVEQDLRELLRRLEFERPGLAWQGERAVMGPEATDPTGGEARVSHVLEH